MTILDFDAPAVRQLRVDLALALRDELLGRG